MNNKTTKNKNMSLVIVATIVITVLVDTCQSVIMPPLNKTQHHELRKASETVLEDRKLSSLFKDDDEARNPTLTIPDGDQLTVQVNSTEMLKIFLDQSIDGDVQVNVSVLSGSGLIHLLDKNSSSDSYVLVTYLKGESGDKNILFKTGDLAGHAEITCKVVHLPTGVIIDDSKAFTSIDIAKSWTVYVIINIVGWIYFFAWSISFYFQVKLNYSRKSVVGLNFDFLALNFLGFSAYSIYNVSLLFSRNVQQEYYINNSYHRIPVEWNDLFFSLHAVLITLVTISQCLIYERGDQKVSMFACLFIAASCAVSLSLYICHLFNWLGILSVVMFISYVKLVITLIKYVPQAWMNYKNNSTEGWSIFNIMLDFTGGIFSLMQMFLSAYNYDDWISIFGNFTKFGLGIFSIMFDILFLVQHFALYKGNGPNTSHNQVNDSNSYDQATQNSEEEEERQRRIQASSGAITASQTQNQGVYINEDLIA